MNLKELLKEKKFTQQLLAKKMGVSPLIVNLWVNNKAIPSLKRLIDMAEVLKVKPGYLIDVIVKKEG